MTLIRKLALALCLAGSLIASSTNGQDLVAGQVYNTVNLVNSSTSASSTTTTWQNVGSWNQGLPCWQPSDAWTKGAYCGPLPYFNNGSFNFSYGQTDVYQTVNISTAMPAGTGIQVNGFNFGFTAKNGNGWDNGQQDYLKAYVNVVGAKNTVVAGYDYSSATNRKYDWSTFNFSETFTTPYPVAGLKSVTYGFVGRDTNGWAGPYGPEIYNVNFSLKYSVDPCVVNPLSSPTCPGFKDAMAKLSPQTTTTTDTTTNTTATMTTPTAMADPTKNDVNNTNIGGVQITSTGEIVPIVNTPKFVRMPNDAGTPLKEKEKEKIVVKTVPVVPQAPVVATRRAKADDGTSAALASAAQSSTVETIALVQKTETTQSSSAPAQQQAFSVAPVIVRKAQQMESTTTQETVATESILMSAIPLKPATTASSSSRKTGPESSMMPEELPKDLAPKQDELTQQSLSGRGIGIVALPQGLKPNVNFSVDVPQISTSFAANALSPLRSAMETRPIESTTTESTQTVKKDVQNNELAGGVDLTKMAVQPIGFADYMNLALTDSAFYGPKEVYQNQRVVDNARAQRLLSGASDRLYQELVNSQYKGQ